MTKGTFWNLFATICNQGSIVAVNIFVARIIGKHSFGEYSIVVNTLLTIAVLVQLSMGYTATKYVAEFRSTDKTKTGRVLGMCALITVATAFLGTLFFVLASPWLATYAMQAPHLTSALVIGSGYLLFSAINGYQVGALAGLEGYQSLGRAAIISGAATVICVALGAILFELKGALIGLSASSLLRCFFHYRWLSIELHQQGIQVTYNNFSQEKDILLKFALPASLSGYITMPAIWLGNTILIRQNGGFEQMALYSAAMTFRMLVMFVPQVINNVGLSILNNHKGRGDWVQYRKTFWTTLSVNGGVVMLISAFLRMLGPFLLQLFGKDFHSAYPVLKILILAALVETGAISVYQIVQSQGKIWESLFFVALPYCLMFLVFAYFLAPLYGASGLAAAYALGWAVNFASTSLLARKTMIETDMS